MNFETLKRISKMEKAIEQLEVAVLTLKMQIEDMKKPPVDLDGNIVVTATDKRPTLTLRKNRVW